MAPASTAALRPQRATVELANQGMAGSVVVAGQSVSVTVTATVDHLILPGSRSVSSTSTATPVGGVAAP